MDSMKLVRSFFIFIIQGLFFGVYAQDAQYFHDCYEIYRFYMGDSRARSAILFLALHYKSPFALNYYSLLPFAVEARDSNGSTLLHHGVQRNFPNFVIRLLKFGANVNAQDGLGHTPVMLAVKQNNIVLLDLLLSRGGSHKIQNFAGWNPLMIACHKGHEHVVSHLLKFDCNISIPKQSFCTLARLGQINACSIQQYRAYDNIVKFLLHGQQLCDSCLPSPEDLSLRFIDDKDSPQKIARDELVYYEEFLKSTKFGDSKIYIEKLLNRVLPVLQSIKLSEIKEVVKRELIKEYILVGRVPEILALLRMGCPDSILDELISFVCNSYLRASEKEKLVIKEIREYLLYFSNQNKIRPPCKCVQQGLCPSVAEWEDLNEREEEHPIRNCCLLIVFYILKAGISIISRFIF